VEAHLQLAQHSHRQRFGQTPKGLWPAEGALSTAFLRQIADAGFTWTASSQGVLRHSAGPGADTGVPWQAPEDIPGDLTLFFRNEHLSDLIGFEYARWHGRDAAAHFMSEVVTLHERAPEGLIPVFLDGENAWEYYPYNGWYFFNDLYESLARNPAIRTLTLSEAAEGHRHRRQRLPRLVAGSWVYGTYPEFRFSVHFSGWLLDVLLRALPRRHGAPGRDDPARPGRMVRLRRLRAGAGGHPASRPGQPDRHALGQDRAPLRHAPDRCLAHRAGLGILGGDLAGRHRHPLRGGRRLPLPLRRRGRLALDSFFSTDEDGRRLDLFPISEAARYRLPFSPAGETVAWLEDLARQGAAPRSTSTTSRNSASGPKPTSGCTRRAG
jgi:hypothetical protein